MATRRLILPTDPPSLPAQKYGLTIFDDRPHRNRGMPAAPEFHPHLLNRVIATAVEFGMPRREAEEARTNAYVRWHVAQLACMVWDAAEGNPQAQAALDRIRFAFEHRGAVAEMIDAKEQPADSGELTKLLGADY